MATVATIQDADIFDLLRQAEERLEAGSKSIVPLTSKPTLESDAAVAEPFVQAPATQEEKTVREPITKSKSATKKKVRHTSQRSSPQPWDGWHSDEKHTA